MKKDVLALLVTKRRAIIFTVLWLVGGLLMILAMTDLFTESIFKKRNTVQLLLLFVNTFYTIKIWNIYLYKIKTKSHS